jgi:glycerophosphoryl diester phosphodiesterase
MRNLAMVLCVASCSSPPHGAAVDTTASPFAERPRALVASMPPGPLKTALQGCAGRPLTPTTFSIGHRGAALGFPEHTRESYEAAAAMGAGLIECDVTFTRDRELVCRHSQCDLHTTTNILSVPALAAKCSVPPAPGTAARCCTSDLSLAEFESLCGKKDDDDSSCGKVMSHRESIALIDRLGRSFIPELKSASVPMPYGGDYTEERFVEQLLSEYRAAGIDPRRVFVQSANERDVTYLLAHAPAFADHAIFLDERADAPDGYDAAVADLPRLAAEGVRIVAPPIHALLTKDAGGRFVPSTYATTARANRLGLLTWTLERAGFDPASIYIALDVLAREVGIRGMFSDWPATVTYYDDCVGHGAGPSPGN